MTDLCESVTLHDAVLDPVHLQVHGDVEVPPRVKEPTLGLWQTLAFDPRALRKPRVLHPGLNDAHGVILKVVVHDHRSDAVVLLRREQDALLEVRIEAEHLRSRDRVEERGSQRKNEQLWLHHTFLSRATKKGMKPSSWSSPVSLEGTVTDSNTISPISG